MSLIDNQPSNLNNLTATPLAAVDWLIIAMFASAILLIVYFANKKNNPKNFKEYLLLSRSLTLPLFVLTLAPSWYGSIIAVSQISFSHGLYGFITQGVLWYFSYLLLAFFAIHKLKQYPVLSVPDLLKINFGHKSGTISAYFIYLKSLPIAYAISLGIIVNYLFNIELSLAIILSCAFVGSYSMFSSFKSIIITDSLQFAVMLSGIVITCLFSLIKVAPFTQILNTLPAEHLSVTGSFNVTKLSVWFLISLSATIINPTFFQRIQATVNNKTAKQGLLCCIAIWIIFDISVLVISFYARALLPNVHPNHALLAYATTILPIGLKGLMLSSIITTISSTFDAYLLNCSSLLFYDLKLFKRFNLSKKSQHKLGVIISVIFTACFAIIIDKNFERLWYYTKSIFNGLFFVPVMICYLSNEANKLPDRQFIASFVCSLTCILLNYFGQYGFEPLYLGLAVSLISFVLFNFSFKKLQVLRSLKSLKSLR